MTVWMIFIRIFSGAHATPNAITIYVSVISGVIMIIVFFINQKSIGKPICVNTKPIAVPILTKASDKLSFAAEFRELVSS
jgi:Flp pilus assembly protein protease CpaA